MATQTATANGPTQNSTPEQRLQKDIYADAPEEGRVALKKIMSELEVSWHIAYPDLTAAESLQLKLIGKQVEKFLGKNA